MGKMDAGLYDPVCPEDPDEIVEDEEFEEIMPPCKECEKHFYYRKSTFNHFDALFVLISMGTLVADMATDTLVTVQYFKSPNPHSNAWASLTLAFTLGPSIVMQIFSASWYVADEDMTRWRWLMHLFQFAPLQRYLRVFRTGLIARKSDDPIDFQRLHHQQSDVAMLRLFEAFLESAPQVVLQLYIMMATKDLKDENLYTGISALVSLFSLCWAMVAYSKNHRKVRNDKNVMSVPGLVLQTIWRIGMISSRVMALVLFASLVKIYIFVFAAIHWFCMTAWVYLQNTDFCDSWVEERIFNSVIGVIYIFCFFNLKEGNSRYRVMFFYAIMFGENVLLITSWYIYRDKTKDKVKVEWWYDPVGFGIVFGGFAIGVTSMLFYYRFFHPRGSGAILLFKKAKHEDAHHLTPKHRPPRQSIDQAEISRRTRSPTPRRRSPHKSPGASPIAYPITTRSLTPCKYSPLKSDGELPYDRYGMRRRSPQNRSQSEACINKSYSPNSVTPIRRQARVHSESTVNTPFQRQGRVHSESFCSHDRTPVEMANFEFSGFATDLVKQFDKKLDKACVSAISNHCNCSYGSYGFDVEAQNTSQSHSDMSTTKKSEHKVMVHASSSQPDMRQAAKTMVNEHDQSSVLLEPVPSTAKRGRSLSKIKNAYEVQNMYHEMMNEDSEEKPKRTRKKLIFGQGTLSPSPPIGSAIKRTPNPMCPYHQQVSAQKSRSLPPMRQQTWQVCEINSEPQKSQKVHNISRGLPKVPLQPEVKVQQPQPLNNQVQNKLKIPHDTSKAERAMLKCGEKRKFSFREQVPAASLKAMRFTPKVPRMAPPGYGGAEPGSPIWRLRDLNARLWQPQTVDIYQPKVNNLPQPKVVAQPFDNSINFSAGNSDQTAHKFSFNSDADNSSPQFNSGNFYTIFAPPTQTKSTNQTNHATPVSSAGNISTISSQGFSTCNLRRSFEYSRKKKSPPSNPNSTRKSENIYATIEEADESENHDYSDLASRSGCSSGSGGSSGKKRKLSPGADLPQKDLKESQQSAHPITPLTPTKSYRLADRDLENSPHRHLSTVKSDKTRSRLQYTGSNNPFNTTDVYVSMDQIKPNVFSNKVQSTSRAAEPSLNKKEPVSTYNRPARPAEPKSKTKEPVPTYDVPTSRLAAFPTQPSSSLPKPPELRSTKTTLEKTGATLIRSDRELSTLPKKDVSERCSQQDLTMASASNLSAASSLHLDANIIVSSSMSAINAIQPEQPISSKNSESTSQEKKSSKTKKSSGKKSASSLELSQGKSQSLPEINSTSKDTMAKVKKGIKPKAHSDNRETTKQPSSSGGGRKPLASLQNTSNTSLANRGSTSNKPSSKEKPSFKFIKPMTPIDNALPLMKSTPALPDCRKLLQFESTGAKPKTKPQVVKLDSVKTSRKPSLSPVESVSPSSPDENDENSNENSSSSLPFPFELTTPIQVRNDDESRLILTGASIMKSRLHERVGQYNPNIFRSGKENLAMARVFDMLSPTDSFVSSLAFQVHIEPRRHVSFEPHRQVSFEPRRLNIPPQKPPRMSLTKIPRNMVANNVAKFSNDSDT